MPGFALAEDFVRAWNTSGVLRLLSTVVIETSGSVLVLGTPGSYCRPTTAEKEKVQ